MINNIQDMEENTTDILNLSEWNISLSILNTSGTKGVVPFRKGGLPWGFYPVIEAAILASFFCLIATVAVYRYLPEFHNVPGRNLVSLCLCLAATYTFLFVDFVFGPRWIRPNRTACLVVASGTHFFFVAVFAWTNVLAYDIWHTVSRTNRPVETCSRKDIDGRKKYLRYASYAWLTTVLISSPALIQAWGSYDLSGYVPNPNFGLRRCWLNDKKAFLVYFNCPVGLILLANMIFFAFTARTLIQIRKLTNVLNVRQQKDRFHLYLKLFLVMGFVWISEFIPLVTGLYILYAVAGLLTSLHGVALFIIFVCKRRIWNALRPLFVKGCSRTQEGAISNQCQRTKRLQSITTLCTSLSSINVGGLNVTPVDKSVVHEVLRKNSSRSSALSSVCERPM